MCSYVYAHLEEGYTQGMCDIAGPLLVIFEDGMFLKIFLLFSNA